MIISRLVGDRSIYLYIYMSVYVEMVIKTVFTTEIDWSSQHSLLT